MVSRNNRFEMDSDSDDSYEERRRANLRKQWFEDSSDQQQEKRVVRTQKQKKWAVITTHCQNIKKKLRIQDFVSTQSEYESMNRHIENSQALIARQGLPATFIRALVRLQDSVNQVTKDQKKKFNTNNAKAYTKLRQQLKKNNVNFQEEIDQFRANPIQSEEEIEESEEEVQEEKEEEEEEEDEESDSWGSESESEEEEPERPMDDPAKRRAIWEIKKTDKPKDLKTQVKTRTIRTQKQAKETVKQVVKIEYTPAVIQQKIKEVLQMRGRASLMISQQVETLKQMILHSPNNSISLQILALMVPFQIEMFKNIVTVILPKAHWDSILANLDRSLDLLEKLPNQEQAFANSLWMYIERLYQQNYKALKSLQTEDEEYLKRIQDQLSLSRLISRGLKYYENQFDIKAKLSLLVLKMVYHIPEALVDQLKNKVSGQHFFNAENYREYVISLAQTVEQYGSTSAKKQAELLLVIFHCVNNRYQEACELIPSEIDFEDLHNQVLYNRIQAYLGLAAFRAGLLVQSFCHLYELMNSGKIQTLLSQILYLENKKAQKDYLKRYIPEHIHIQVKELEDMFLLASIAIDAPSYLLPSAPMASKPFQKFISQGSKYLYSGPTETSRSKITQIFEAVKAGDWERTQISVEKFGFWKELNQESQEKLMYYFRSACMLCFLMLNAQQISVVPLSTLQEMFGIEEGFIPKLVSDNRIKEVMSVQCENGCLQIHSTEKSKIDRLMAGIEASFDVLKENIDFVASKDNYLTKVLEKSVFRHYNLKNVRRPLLRFKAN